MLNTLAANAAWLKALVLRLPFEKIDQNINQNQHHNVSKEAAKQKQVAPDARCQMQPPAFAPSTHTKTHTHAHAGWPSWYLIVCWELNALCLHGARLGWVEVLLALHKHVHVHLWKHCSAGRVQAKGEWNK